MGPAARSRNAGPSTRAHGSRRGGSPTGTGLEADDEERVSGRTVKRQSLLAVQKGVVFRRPGIARPQGDEDDDSRVDDGDNLGN
jgi:hypothetical protein